MFTIIGYKKIKYTNKDKKEINGVEFYLIDDESYEGIEGNQTVCLYLPLEKINGKITVGATAELVYTLMKGTPRINGINIK